MSEAQDSQSEQHEDKTQEVTESRFSASLEEKTVHEEVSEIEAFEGEAKPQEETAHQEEAESQDATISPAHGAHAASAPKTKRKRTGLIIGIIVGAILLIAIAIALVPAIFANIGRSQLADVQWPEDAKVIEYGGTTYEYDPNVITVCVIGNDRSRHIPTEEFNGQADAVIVAAVNTETGEVTCLSIPRNTMVEGWTSFEADPEERTTQEEQLCLVYSHGKSDEFSSENVCHSVSTILGVPIKNYFTVQEEAIGALADAIGGVTLMPSVTIPNTLIVEGEEILMTGPKLHEFEAPTIYGGTAMDYTIWRDKGENDSSVHRGERQLQFLKAFIPQAVEKIKANPALVMDLYNVVSAYSTTNLDASELSYIASVLVDHPSFDLNMIPLPGETSLDQVGEDTYWEEVHLDEDAVKHIVLDVFYEPAP